MDESLSLVRRLLAGELVDHDGDSFHLERASIVPSPTPVPPVVVGGRSTAAMRRAGHMGEGWLGVWVSPERFASSVATVEQEAAKAGRADVAWQHGLLAWCGLATQRTVARDSLARGMEAFYGLPFERFERSSPYGTPDDVADVLRPYVDAGATSILLSPIASSTEEGLEGVARVSELLNGPP